MPSQVPPILMGVYRQRSMLSLRSEPAVLAAEPGHVRLTGLAGVLLDAPAQQIRAKGGRRLGQVTLRAPGSSHVVAGFSTLHHPPFAAEQLAQLDSSRAAIETDPRTRELMAGRALYLATGGAPDGDFAPEARHLRARPLGRLVDFGAALEELLRAVGVGL